VRFAHHQTVCARVAQAFLSLRLQQPFQAEPLRLQQQARDPVVYWSADAMRDAMAAISASSA
jgi:hypothetical protein